MTDDRVGTADILDALVEELQLAEGWREAMAAAVNRHYSIGSHLSPFKILDEMHEAFGDDLPAAEREGLVRLAASHADAHAVEIGRQWRRLEEFAYGFVASRAGGNADLAAAIRAEPGGVVAAGIDACLVALDPAQVVTFLEVLGRPASGRGRYELAVYPAAAMDHRWARLRIVGERADERRPDYDDPLLVQARCILRGRRDEGVAVEAWLPAGTRSKPRWD